MNVQTPKAMYQIEDPDYGTVTFSTLDMVLEEIQQMLEAYSMFPCEIEIKVTIVQMTQEEFDALPVLDR